MHPAVIVIPVVALIFGPQLWVRQVLKRHNRKEEDHFCTGGELARELLARHQLHSVKVESTDIGDHYDPKAKAVRLTRDKLDRKTLTAMTTAAHEVSHALQDASNYGPFIWRMRLVKLAHAVGQVGTVILMAVPAAAVFTQHRVPPLLIGSAVVTILGTGMAAQMAALPTELDASFGRAMPMLRDGHISDEQSKDAREILIASSLTYVAASFLAVLNIWPWLGAGPVQPTPQNPRNSVLLNAKSGIVSAAKTDSVHRTEIGKQRLRRRSKPGMLETVVRQIGKPLIRGWFQICRPLS